MHEKGSSYYWIGPIKPGKRISNLTCFIYNFNFNILKFELKLFK